MNKPVKMAHLIATAVFAAASTAAVAQTGSGYVVSPDNQVVVDPFGLCWRTTGWTPGDATKDCDADLLPKEAPKPAPPPPPPPAPAPAPVPAPAPAPQAEKVTFAADAFFDFDKSALKPEGQARLDDLVSKIRDMTLEVVIAVGHTDSIGAADYNQRLSVRRAESVKSYLVSKGIEANRVYTEGKGESQPVASNQTRDGRAKNRRVEIEVVGTRMR
ncbi:MAG: OmpA family protein [Burkholderiaceae bacterium]|jgi:OOP family OmpA-OmpF porin|nr:OmpA family protein [Burkholderiaceae bacterium]MEB2320755.1 OmpA family protein [Pseudomonadota bacterium]